MTNERHWTLKLSDELADPMDSADTFVRLNVSDLDEMAVDEWNDVTAEYDFIPLFV